MNRFWWWVKVALSAVVFFGVMAGMESLYRRYYWNKLRATACTAQGGQLLSEGELVICGYGVMPKRAPASP